MATIEQFEARLRPYKLALVKAFGLDPDTTSSNVSASPTSVTLMQLGGSRGEVPAPAIVRGADEDGVVTVVFPAEHWTDEQCQVVENYLAQFPPKFSLGDPDEMREAFLASKHHHRLMCVPEENMTVSITEFISARLDEDEAAARAAVEDSNVNGEFLPWRLSGDMGTDLYAGHVPITTGPYGGMDKGIAHHIARHSPARILREIAAKRAIIAEHTPDLLLHSPETPQSCPVCYYEDADLELHPCPTLRRFAAAYPDCPEEWRPKQPVPDD